MSERERIFGTVIETHGEELFDLVMTTGLAAEAARQLAASAPRSHLVMLVNAFNRLADAYCGVKGWTPEEIAACDRDLQLAYAGRIQVVGRLDS